MARGFKIAEAFVEIEANTAGLRRDAREGIVKALRGLKGEVGLKVNTRGLRREAREAIQKATRGLDGSFGLQVSARALRRQVRAVIREATAGLEIRIPVVADSSGLRREVDRAIRIAEAGQRINIPVHADGSITNNFGNAGRRAGSRFTRMLVSALTAGVPLAVAALEPLLNSAGALTAVFGAAALGIGAFALAATPAIMQVAKAWETYNEWQDAVAAGDEKKAAKMESLYKHLVSEMSPAVRDLNKAWIDARKNFQDWGNAQAEVTSPALTAWLNAVNMNLDVFNPLVLEASGSLKYLGESFNKYLRGDEFNTLVKDLRGHVGPAIESVFKSAGNVVRGFFGIVRAFLPQSNEMAASMERATGKFANWANQLGTSQGFMEFVEQAKENGPLVAKAIGAIGRALGHLLEASQPVGKVLLGVVTGFAELVDAIPTEFLTALVAARLGLTALGLAVSATSRIIAISPLGRLAVGVAAIAGALEYFSNKAKGAAPDADLLQGSLARLANSGVFTGELRKAFGDISSISGEFDRLDGGVKKNIESGSKLSQVLGGIFGLTGDESADAPLTGWARGMVDNLTNGSKSVEATEERIDSLDKALAAMVNGGHAELAAGALRKLGISHQDSKKYLNDYQEAMNSARVADELYAQSLASLGPNVVDAARAMRNKEDAARSLANANDLLNGTARALLGTELALKEGLDAIGDSVKENGNSLNINTEKGRANLKVLSNQITAIGEYSSAVAKQTGSTQAGAIAHEQQRRAFIKAGLAAGYTREELVGLLDKYDQLPKNKETRIAANTVDAQEQLQRVINKIKDTPGAKSVTVKTLNKQAIDALEATGLKVRRLPDGSFRVSAKDQASGIISRIRGALNGIDGKVATSTVRTVYESIYYTKSVKTLAAAHGRAKGGLAPRYAKGGRVQMYPGGGLVQGPGGPTSDSILAMMANGPARISDSEYIMRASAVRKYGVGLMDAMNSGTLPEVPGFAVGGYTKRRKVGPKNNRRYQYYFQGKWYEKAAYDSAYAAAKQLASDTTFTHFGKMAKSQGSFHNTEMQKALGKPENTTALVSALNAARSQIIKSTSGKEEYNLLKKINASGKQLIAYEDKLSKVNVSLDKAKEELEDLQGSFNSLKDSVKSSIIEFANITKIGKYGTSGGTLLDQLRGDVGKAGAFSSQLAQLKSKGVDGALIQQIAEAGITGGGAATAATILGMSPAQIAELNALQKQLTGYATSAGTTTADAMYGAGIRAAEGLVAGLTAEQKAIEKAMMNIAKSMEAAIKKALNIKSPSRVMQALGEFTSLGFARGIADGRKAVNTAALDMVSVPVSVKPTVALPQQGNRRSGDIHFHGDIVINAAGMDLSNTRQRKAVAAALASDIKEAIRQDDRKRKG